MPEGAPSEAAQEGTKAHALAATLVEAYAHGEATDAVKDYPIEMIDGAYLYLDTIKEDAPDDVHVEEELDLYPLVSEGYGTCDCWAVGHVGELLVYDYKYGKGGEVQAEENYQLAIYAFGAASRRGIVSHDQHGHWVIDCPRELPVTMTIVQPRLEQGNRVKRWSLTIDELMKWLTANVMEQSNLAILGLGEATPGDWCRWCRAKAICSAQAVAAPDLADLIDGPVVDDEVERPRAALSEEQLAYYVRTAEDTIKWLQTLLDYATTLAVKEGKQWPGMALSTGRSVRRWRDTEAETVAIETILRETEIPEDEVYIRQPLSLAKLERLVGKDRFAELVGEYVDKPKGAPKLVPLKSAGRSSDIRHFANENK